MVKVLINLGTRPKRFHTRFRQFHFLTGWRFFLTSANLYLTLISSSTHTDRFQHRFAHRRHRTVPREILRVSIFHFYELTDSLIGTTSRAIIVTYADGGGGPTDQPTSLRRTKPLTGYSRRFYSTESLSPPTPTLYPHTPLVTANRLLGLL